MAKIYDTYKDSGITWIGNIPSEWNVDILSLHLYDHCNYNKELKEKNLLSLSYGKIVRKDINTKEGLLPESFNRYNIIEKGDIVLRLTDLQNDKKSLRTGLCQERGIITSAYLTLRNRGNDSSAFLHYLLHSYDLYKVFYGMGNGVRQGMNYSDIRKLKMIIPPFPEQEAIASFLDRKCGEIDSLISLQEEMISELQAYKQSIITEAVTKGLNPNAPMKDSEVEWIGMIPKEWSIDFLSKIIWLRARLGWKGLKAEEYVEKGFPFLSAFNIVNNKLKWEGLNFINKERYDESPEIKLSIGDVLIVKDGAGIGKTARIDQLPEGEATVNSSLGVITPSEKLDYKYLHYFLLSNSFQNIIGFIKNGMGVPHLTQENMKSVLITTPPLSEQQAIASYLDEKTSQIDSLIALKQEKITELKDYKKSIIYEYVTGKKKV